MPNSLDRSEPDWLSLGQLGKKAEPLPEHSLVTYLEQRAALHRRTWNSPPIPGRKYSLLFLGYHFRELKQRVAGLATDSLDYLPQTAQIITHRLFGDFPGVWVNQVVAIGPVR